MEELTPRQAEVLAFIRETIKETGAPPTRAEIAYVFGFSSVNAAEGHLKNLERKGYIELIPGTARGIRLTEPRGLPLVGKVAAGMPILSEEHVEARYPVEGDLFQPQADFLLRVKGDSMKEAGILDGDLVAVHHNPRVRSGNIVVARLDGEVTVKRLRREGTKVHLLPENPDYEPLVVDPRKQDFVIEGQVVGVLRGAQPL